jgi:hypothetical protein
MNDHIYEDHPDPSWARRLWVSLDGTWSIRWGKRESAIRVPFPIGSAASGVDFPDSGTFVYSRDFDYPSLDPAKRYELHVGACDYEAEVFLNGRRLGAHRGGYASFSFDITEAIRSGANRLEIVVVDSHNAGQARGKQTFLRKPFYVWYSGIAGIWQSVWIEETGKSRLVSARVRSDFASRMVEVIAQVEPGIEGGRGLFLEAEIVSPAGERGVHAFKQAADAPSEFRLSLPFEAIGARPWSPEDPSLFALRYRLRADGLLCDSVESYFGLRIVEARGGGLWLNGNPLYLRMALVQGYYPEGVYTPLSSSVAAADIEALKSMGFNGARVHEKIESPYFQYLCDKMGLLTTMELPSFYLPSRKAFAAYESELRELIERDIAHPSCIARILFNETWGIWGVYRRKSKTRRFVTEMIRLAREADPTRLVIDNSGWEHLDTDIVDFHHYLGTSTLARETYARLASRDEKSLHGSSLAAVLAFYLFDRVASATRTLFLERSADRADLPWFLSEYGGFGWYGSAEPGEAIDKIEAYTRDIVESGLFCGYCLTQLYDVGSEVNGLLSFDRRPKVEAERMRRINAITRPLRSGRPRPD